ncbi:MAG: PTS sugar transporter subunit IIA [Acidobacteriota bacterium]
MKLSHLLRPEHVFLDLPAETREDVLRHVAEQLAEAGLVRNADALVELLLDRERLGATVVGEETAIPHCKVPGLRTLVAAFVRTRRPVSFGATENEKVRLFFFVLSPREQPAAHLQVLANIARLLRNAAARRHLLEAQDGDELLAALTRLEATP